MLSKSKVRRLYDFQQLPLPEKMREVTVSRREIHEALHQLSVRFLTIEPVETAREGDYVLLDGDGKKRQAVIGRDTLPADCRVGDRVCFSGREGTVLSIKRRMLPPVTDELVSRLGLEDVKTVGEYEAYLLSQLAAEHGAEKMQGIVSYMARETFLRSEVEDLDREISWYFAYLVRYYRQQAELEGVPYEEVLSTVATKAQKTVEEKEAYLRSHGAAEAVRMAALGMALAEERGAALSEENLRQEYLEDSRKAGRESSAEELDEAVAIQLLFYYAQYFSDAVWAHMETKFIPILTN